MFVPFYTQAIIITNIMLCKHNLEIVPCVDKVDTVSQEQCMANSKTNVKLKFIFNH